MIYFDTFTQARIADTGIHKAFNLTIFDCVTQIKCLRACRCK